MNSCNTVHISPFSLQVCSFISGYLYFAPFVLFFLHFFLKYLRICLCYHDPLPLNVLVYIALNKVILLYS